MDRERYAQYNENWQRSEFSDKFSPYNITPRWTRSLTDVSAPNSVYNKPRNTHGQYGHFPHNINNGINRSLSKERQPKPPYEDYPVEFHPDELPESESTEVVRESDDTHPDRSFVCILSRFAERTSCVGPPYINSANHFYSKFFWSVVFVAMLIATAVNLYLNVEAFTAFSVKTTISIGYSPLTFPMVTVCNTNPVRKSAQKMGSEDLQEFITSLNPQKFERNPLPNGPPPGRKKRFVDIFQREQVSGNKTFRPQPNGIGDRFGGDADPLFEAQEEFTYLIGQESAETRYEMSHQLDEMMLSCSFEGRSCELDNFTSFLTDDYGACYSFNQVRLDSNELPLYKSYRRGNKYGLQLMMFLQTDEYIPGLGLGYGLRVGVSYPKNIPFPDVDGVFVSAGTETDVGVKMINVTRLGGRYGSCASSGAFAEEFGFEYSRQACQSVCPHRFILSACECYDPAELRLYPLNTSESYSPCASEDEYACMSDIQLAVTVDETMKCPCPSPCDERAYDTVLSSRQWPEDDYMHALIDKVCRTPGQKKTCDQLLGKPPTEQRRNFVKLNVFYRDLNFEELIEEPDYPESQFFSDIGGSIGLWVGLSIISLMEVLELVLQIFVWIGRRLMQCRRRDQRRRNSQRAVKRDLQIAQSRPKHNTTTTPRPTESSRRSNLEERRSNYTFPAGDSLW